MVKVSYQKQIKRREKERDDDDLGLWWLIET